MIKPLLKKAMFALAPRASASYFAARGRAYSHRYLESRGVPALNRKLTDRLGTRVLVGPFEGMVLSASTHREHIGPYLLGCYEQAIQPWVERAIAARPTLVIDVGSKVGFYAVGMARRLGGTRVVAFDTDPWARTATAEMAAANDVSVEVRSFCDPAAMRSLLVPGAFVISDCEGYEGHLLTQETASDYRDASLLIETHESLAPGVEARIISAFSATHTIEATEDSGQPSPQAIDLSFLEPAEMAICADEFRSANRWLLLTPKTT